VADRNGIRTEILYTWRKMLTAAITEPTAVETVTEPKTPPLLAASPAMEDPRGCGSHEYRGGGGPHMRQRLWCYKQVIGDGRDRAHEGGCAVARKSDVSPRLPSPSVSRTVCSDLVCLISVRAA